ncbi:hypothetical protein [Okeania sp. SIO2C2]|uniref:hypothetical protein n=1 Tax=Okeania sp. SIO2C2 TaxID=2607787 RepID=UPI002580CC28|nr:hypothetical protein [Okeania sp. SIO2C2]
MALSKPKKCKHFLRNAAQTVRTQSAFSCFLKKETGDRRQETGDRRKITWGFAPPSNFEHSS